MAGALLTSIAGLFTLGHMHGKVLESHDQVATNEYRIEELEREITNLGVESALAAGPVEVNERARERLGMVEISRLVSITPVDGDSVEDGVTRLLLTPVRIGGAPEVGSDPAEGGTGLDGTIERGTAQEQTSGTDPSQGAGQQDVEPRAEGVGE